MNNIDKKYTDLLQDILDNGIKKQDRNRVIEVKSTYTFNKEKEKNLLKRELVLNKNINFNFIIL